MKLFATLAALTIIAPMGAFASNVDDTVGSVEVCPGVLKTEVLEYGKIYSFYESTDPTTPYGDKEAACEVRFQ